MRTFDEGAIRLAAALRVQAKRHIKCLVGSIVALRLGWMLISTIGAEGFYAAALCSALSAINAFESSHDVVKHRQETVRCSLKNLSARGC